VTVVFARYIRFITKERTPLGNYLIRGVAAGSFSGLALHEPTIATERKNRLVPNRRRSRQSSMLDSPPDNQATVRDLPK
jgi:hypothetical protein